MLWLTDRKVNSLAVEFSSSFLIGGLYITFYSFSNLGWLVVALQILYVAIFLSIARFVVSALKSKPVFFGMFISAFGLFSIAPSWLIENQLLYLVDLSCVFAAVLFLLAFMAYCRPRHLISLGWQVRIK